MSQALFLEHAFSLESELRGLEKQYTTLAKKAEKFKQERPVFTDYDIKAFSQDFQRPARELSEKIASRKRTIKAIREQHEIHFDADDLDYVMKYSHIIETAAALGRSKAFQDLDEPDWESNDSPGYSGPLPGHHKDIYL
jgi:hypothetical protein